MMRIVIDMQGAQSIEHRNRGIGRYTHSLVKALLDNKGNDEVFLALNGAFPDTISSIRDDYAKLISQDNICVWYPTGTTSYVNQEASWQREVSELVREAFLISLKPDVVLITSLFEGFSDSTLLSINRLGEDVFTAVVLYDLIPYIYPDIYLKDPARASWYQERLTHLRRADLQLAISSSSRLESIDYLKTPPDKVINISTAADSHFQPVDVSSEEEALRARYNLSKPFVMYTGGIDYRKNIEGLITAYALLPSTLRQSYQLAIVTSINVAEKKRLLAFAKEHHLDSSELILTGFVAEEELVVLYNLCALFVFPSLHEGFGLPVLEAMACGRAVIGSNCSSVPEVIGCKEALFDPHNSSSIANKMQQVLTNTAMRKSLEAHAYTQSQEFSWEKTAQRTLLALREAYANQKIKNHFSPISTSPLKNKRPKLAYVSPMPPERSGIAFYSAELIPELSKFYDIELILAQDTISKPFGSRHYIQRNVQWLYDNATSYDRIIYHFGNSTYHQHMFKLLEKIPGVVVLHDFFLSGILTHMEVFGFEPRIWTNALYTGHGYQALQRRYSNEHTIDYPCNLSVLQNAAGLIVHSQTSIQLAKHWYGDKVGVNWHHIPLLREPEQSSPTLKNAARKMLGLKMDGFIVSSFGLISPTKANHRLLHAWCNSILAKDERCVLVFVGENDGGQYGEELLESIKLSPYGHRIKITGWSSTEEFKLYLQASDIGVQLRSRVGGETSAAVLDCMNFALPVIVNANGSMAELPNEAIWKLANDFTNEELTAGLNALYSDDDLRQQLGQKAQQHVHTHHAPAVCAKQYTDAIEQAYQNSNNVIPLLINKIALADYSLNNTELASIALAIDRSVKESKVQQQILVDVSELVRSPSVRTGIQRVVRSVLQQWLFNPPKGYRIEPVYASINSSGYYYAREFTSNFMGYPAHGLNDDPINYQLGDVFIALDLQPHVQIANAKFYQMMRNEGVSVQFVVYDLLPILFPEYFYHGAFELHQEWLTVVGGCDGAICISQSVAQDADAWYQTRKTDVRLKWFNLGADIENSIRSIGMPDNAQRVLNQLEQRKTFLMVGTLEPRKGHQQVFQAFEILWQRRIDINLVIIGNRGWMVDALLESIQTHPEYEQRLFWLEGASDEYLETLYSSSSCFIAASYGAGFGLPLIEASRHNLPIIARDIPVFREIAGEHAHFFDTLTAEGLAQELVKWLELYQKKIYPQSTGMYWMTWQQSAHSLLECLIDSPSYGEFITTSKIVPYRDSSG